jgi:hypothetical protein
MFLERNARSGATRDVVAGFAVVVLLLTALTLLSSRSAGEVPQAVTSAVHLNIAPLNDHADDEDDGHRFH